MNPFKDWTPLQVHEHNSRIKVTKEEHVRFSKPIKHERESKLHELIIDYCNKQWPKWKYTHARMDKKSTLDKGHCDFVIWFPCHLDERPKTDDVPWSKSLCIECKRPGEKLSEDQRNWAHEMAMLGHTVHTVTKFEEFLELVK